jgi:hypothetical protein
MWCSTISRPSEARTHPPWVRATCMRGPRGRAPLAEHHRVLGQGRDPYADASASRSARRLPGRRRPKLLSRPTGGFATQWAAHDSSEQRGGLREIGFRMSEEELPTRADLGSADDRRIDLHLLTFDEQGNGLQQLQDGSVGTYAGEASPTPVGISRSSRWVMRSRVPGWAGLAVALRGWLPVFSHLRVG